MLDLGFEWDLTASSSMILGNVIDALSILPVFPWPQPVTDESSVTSLLGWHGGTCYAVS